MMVFDPLDPGMWLNVFDSCPASVVKAISRRYSCGDIPIDRAARINSSMSCSCSH